MAKLRDAVPLYPFFFAFFTTRRFKILYSIEEKVLFHDFWRKIFFFLVLVLF